MTRGAAALALALLGCATAPLSPLRGAVTVSLDPAFTPSERADAEVALRVWSHDAPECARFQIVTAPAALTIRRAHVWIEIPAFPYTAPGVAGMWIESRHEVWIVPLRMSRVGASNSIAMQALFAHEIGHALGLGHSPMGLMAPSPRWDALERGTLPLDVEAAARRHCGR